MQETAAYIALRIKIAGGDAVRLFTREAVMLIHERSGGIPRTISVMCDNALLTACGLGKTRVDSRMVLEVASDFDLGESRGYDSSFSVLIRKRTCRIRHRLPRRRRRLRSAPSSRMLRQSRCRGTPCQLMLGTKCSMKGATCLGRQPHLLDSRCSAGAD